MIEYLAKRGNLYSYLNKNSQLDECLGLGYDIVRRDDSGDTIIATNGEWLEPKPNIEHSFELVFEIPPDVATQIRQNSADLAYISMMTGVDL